MTEKFKETLRSEVSGFDLRNTYNFLVFIADNKLKIPAFLNSHKSLLIKAEFPDKSKLVSIESCIDHTPVIQLSGMSISISYSVSVPGSNPRWEKVVFSSSYQGDSSSDDGWYLSGSEYFGDGHTEFYRCPIISIEIAK